MDLIFNFDEAGYFTGVSDRPIDPVRGKPAAINELVASLDPVPAHDQTTHRVRRVGGKWCIEEIPKPAPTPEPTPQYPRFVGNQKLDLFTPEEQLAIVTSTMSDPVVKLAYDRLLGAAFWTYEDPETESGLAMLESKGHITSARKAEIVAAMQPK